MATVFVDFEEVKAKVGMPEVLEAFGVLGDFKRKGDHLAGPCPLHDHPLGFRNREQFKTDLKDGKWMWH
jgi:hypothetical protein